MQKLELVSNYPCTREHILSLFCNREYLKKKYELLGFSNFKIIDINQGADLFSVKYQYDGNSLPAALVKLLNLQKMTTIICEYQLSLITGNGSMSVHLPALPHLNTRCEIVLEEQQQGSISVNQKMNWSIASNLKIIGGLVERITALDIKKNTDIEVELIKTILNDF